MLIEAQKLIDLRKETEAERLDRIARDAGFISFADYQEQMIKIRNLMISQVQGALEKTPAEKQPTFWTELL